MMRSPDGSIAKEYCELSPLFGMDTTMGLFIRVTCAAMLYILFTELYTDSISRDWAPCPSSVACWRAIFD